jgi:hypothetical protein
MLTWMRKIEKSQPRLPGVYPCFYVIEFPAMFRKKEEPFRRMVDIDSFKAVPVPSASVGFDSLFDDGFCISIYHDPHSSESLSCYNHMTEYTEPELIAVHDVLTSISNTTHETDEWFS